MNAEVGLREAVEALADRWEDNGHVARGKLVQSNELRALLAEHPAPAPEGEVAAGEHAYTSTACHHGRHDRCRETCKFCAAMCVCACHATPPADDATPAPAEPKTADVDAGDVVTIHERPLGLVWSCTCGATGAGYRPLVMSSAQAHAQTHVAALLDRERRAERERIAHAIEAHLDDPRGRDTWTLRDAARIARADALGAAAEGTGGAG